MALDVATFETLCPSRFISFTIPNPTCSDSLLRVAVLDSPVHPTDTPQVAAMLVPVSREADWIFCTESGHLQLLFDCPGISRLILVGNQFKEGDFSPPTYYHAVKCSLHQKGLELWSKPLLLALSPRCLFKTGIPEIPILSYEDNLISGVVIHKSVGCLVGEMLVEDVEIESNVGVNNCLKREFRRRLRFKRMPNLVQTEIRIVPETDLSSNSVGIGEMWFVPELGVLVHPYLAPMVASLSLIGDYIEGLIQRGSRPKALCLGIGGGALLTFLKTQLCFEVMGVDADKEVLRVAKKFFGLEDGEFIHVMIGDAIKSLKKFAYQEKQQKMCSFSGSDPKAHCNTANNEDGNHKFDVIMVDLDSTDVRSGVSAPPLEFVRKHVLLAARLVLSEFGILAINVISPSRSFCCKLIHYFQEVFRDLYKIEVGNGENFVLIATVAPQVSSVQDGSNSFLMRLKLVIPEAYINSIRKI